MSSRSDEGQALLLLLAGLAAVLAAAVLLGAAARALGAGGDAQRAADLGALAGARAMRAAYARLFEPPYIDGRPNRRRIERGAYLALGRDAAADVARRNGAASVSVRFPDSSTPAPRRIEVSVGGRGIALPLGGGVTRRLDPHRVAEAEIAVPAGDIQGGGGYEGPFAYRQGKPMRPDVALAFDRMERAARADGIALLITSAYRSDAEQAVLFARHPDPRWVAPPGRSLHRLGTELDLGPPSAYAWLSANAPRFHFVRRYSWEPWHWGYGLNPGSRPAVAVGDGGGGGISVASLAPRHLRPTLARAAQRWNVSAALLAAQLQVESGFDTNARSPAGALGIAQFMPGTARAYGLRDPFDPVAAIDAQAHLMRDLLRRFGAVPLALAAYNAGELAVARCSCVPPIPETQEYVAAILALLAGRGEAVAGLEIRLVR